MDLVKYIDFFSIKFNFYTNNQPYYQNLFGGIMTLLSSLICIILFLSFSQDEFKRLNPITTISNIPESESKLVNTHQEKIWIPFRIVTEKNKFINHTGILYIIPYLVEGVYDDEMGMEKKYHLLNYKLCNETSMVNKQSNYKIDVELNELFCIEEDNIKFGGNVNNKLINYLEINLYLCKDGINYNISDSRCIKPENLFENNNTFCFDFYYPIVQFQPKNYKSRIAIIYKNSLYRLSKYNCKLDKLYLQEHILSDDKNIIIKNYKNNSYWGMSNLNGDDYFIPFNIDSNVINKTSKIYSLNIYMDTGLVFYTREYKKILLILSDVFPVLRFILFFIKNFTKQIKMSSTKRKLAGLIFENKEKRPKSLFQSRIIYSNKNSNKQMGKQIIEMNQCKNENENNSNIQDNKNSNLEEINNCLNNNNCLINQMCMKQSNEQRLYKNNNSSKLILNHDKGIKILNEKISKKNLSENPPNAKDHSKTKNKTNKRKVANYIFPYYYFFLDIIFDKLIKPQKFFCIPKAYFTVYNFMCQIYDISTHIILFKQFNSLNNMFLEKIYEHDGICPSKPYNKINICDNTVIEKLNKDLKIKKSILFSSNLL